MLEPAEVRHIGNLLLRLENIQAGGTGYRKSAPGVPRPSKFEWKLSKSVESDREALADVLMEIVDRLEVFSFEHC